MEGIGYSLRMKNIGNRVKKYIEKYQMIEKGDRVIAGISGGADSVCLFFVLLELRQEIGFSLIAVHINHGLRGADADADEQFVKQLCEQYEIPLEISRVNLELIAAKRKQSLEEAGRNVRREVLARVMVQYAGNRIAMAHHQNDNAETLLWNLVRGTGLQGLGGIRPVNNVWIRPLLCLSRDEIEADLKERGQGYCIDKTNLETTYTRNKLRHQVLPFLQNEVNSAAVRHMNETMEQMRELREFVEQETQRAVGGCVIWAQGSCQIREKNWRELPGYLQKEVIYDCVERISGTRKNLGRVHIETVCELFEQQVGRKRNLPGAVRGVREYGGIRLEKAKAAESDYVREELFSGRKLQVPGVTCLPEKGLTITCRLLENEEGWKQSEIPQKKYTKWFDYDIIKTCLHIRTRESGDQIAIDREGHRQKLKSWFVNEKIPAKERAGVPLIAEGEQIIWIVGYRMSSAYQVSTQTKRILQIEIEPPELMGDDGEEMSELRS